MAVPSSGVLSLGGLAFEKLEDDYADGLPGTIDDSYGPFSLRDVTQGGDTYGGGEDYDITNVSSASKPNNDAPFGMGEFYGYDHDASNALGGDGSDWHGASYYASGSIPFNGYNSANLGHTSKANACADTSTVQTCSVIMWRGTLGNGTTMYFQFGN